MRLEMADLEMVVGVVSVEVDLGVVAVEVSVVADLAEMASVHSVAADLAEAEDLVMVREVEEEMWPRKATLDNTQSWTTRSIRSHDSMGMLVFRSRHTLHNMRSWPPSE